MVSMVSVIKYGMLKIAIKEPIQFRLMLLFYFCIIAYITKDLFILNTGDYIRVVFPFIDADMNGLRNLTNSGSLIYTLKSERESIFDYFKIYPSSFSFLTYYYAMFIGFFTENFDLRLFSLVGKFIFCFGFFSLWKMLNNNGNKFNLLCCLFLSFYLMIPAYSSMLNSFYQEQVIIYALPWVVIGYLNFVNIGRSITLVCAITFIALAKSQFFILPSIVIISLFLMPIKREVIRKVVFLLVIVQVLTVSFISMSSESTALNKYHATYYGVYLGKYLEDSEFNFNRDSIDVNCIGVDAWGNRYNSEFGATLSIIGENCFEKNKNISMSNLLTFIAKEPEVLTYPLQSVFNDHVKLDYFHVYKKYLLLQGNQKNAMSYMQAFNEKYIACLKLSVAIILMLALFIFSLVKPSLWSAIFWCLSTFTVSQAYISFFGEGYRDLAKHLFPMQYSFDFMLIVAIFVLLARFKRDGENRHIIQ